jgi:hypothetical protein
MIFKVSKKEAKRERPYKLNDFYVWAKSKEGAEKNLKHFLGKKRFERVIK